VGFFISEDTGATSDDGVEAAMADVEDSGTVDDVNGGIVSGVEVVLDSDTWVSVGRFCPGDVCRLAFSTGFMVVTGVDGIFIGFDIDLLDDFFNLTGIAVIWDAGGEAINSIVIGLDGSCFMACPAVSQYCMMVM